MLKDHVRLNTVLGIKSNLRTMIEYNPKKLMRKIYEVTADLERGLVVAHSEEEAGKTFFKEMELMEGEYRAKELARLGRNSDKYFTPSVRVTFHPRRFINAVQSRGPAQPEDMARISDRVIAILNELLRNPVTLEDVEYRVIAIDIKGYRVFLWKGDAFAFIEQSSGILWKITTGEVEG